MASTAKISGSTDSKQPTADVEKQDRLQDSTREQEIRRRAYEIIWNAVHTLAIAGGLA